MLHLLQAAATGTLSWWINLQQPHLLLWQQQGHPCPGSLLVPLGPFQQPRGAPEHLVHGDAKVALGHCHPLLALCVLSKHQQKIKFRFFCCPWLEMLSGTGGWAQAGSLSALLLQSWDRRECSN